MTLFAVFCFAEIIVVKFHVFLQEAAADSESKSEELSRAVEELHKLLKDAGEGAVTPHAQ